MNEYIPDSWVIVEMTHKGKKVKKVLAGWYGGYLGADEWRLSSGITVEVDRGDYYDFHNESGSVYHCSKNAQRFTGLMSGVFADWQKKITEDTNIEHIPYGEKNDSTKSSSL
jgi:hypothetical protein